MTKEVEILGDVNLLSVQPTKAIWQDDTVVIEALHGEAFKNVMQRHRQLNEGGACKNIVLEGRAGAGKSHFLGRVRRDVVHAGDFFIAVHLTQANAFWQAVALCYAMALDRPHSGVTQRQILLDALLGACGIREDTTLPLLAGEVDEAALPAVRSALAKRLGRTPEARTAADIALALILLNSEDGEHQDIAYSIFEGFEIENEARTRVGLKAGQFHPREVVRAIDRLAGACGKVFVVALDQLDGLIAIAHKALAEGDKSEINILANDLMDFSEITEHTIIILSCLRASWALIRDEAIQTAQYRFTDSVRLGDIPSPECGRDLIAQVLGREYARMGFTPPYPTWPVAREAFEDAPDYTPRGLIITVERHAKACAANGAVTELKRLADADTSAEPEPLPPEPDALDKRFAALKAAATVPAPADTALETILPPLLSSALTAFIGENAGAAQLSLDSIDETKPAVNARLRLALDAEREDEIHWSFRVIAQSHGRAQLSRLQAAVTASGLGRQRHLVIIRNTSWSTGAKTREVLGAVENRGGIVEPLAEEDFRTFKALHDLFNERPDGMGAWLRARRPASSTALLRRIELPAPRPDLPADHILIGRTPGEGRTITLALSELRRHAAVFAGSGSGKTVLLRRLIEACALEGVSSIVLDPNNDLARLGTVQDGPHPGWLPGDTDLARRYESEVETVVWTPRMSGGRPLSFAPLAGLSGIGEGDDFEVALDCAVDLLAPRARLSLATAKGQQGRAVLKQAVRAYVRRGEDSLRGFFRFLAALPEGVSELENAEKFAADIAETLKAESINDPMFGDVGEAMDPAALLTPSRDKRARVSVISFVGLPNLEQQQQFVSQLQLAVFSWIKKHPAGDRPLGGLFVMDEAQNFAPSGASTPSTATTLALASQARKYGLGLLFATQAPKGLHNRIPGNCATQIFGFLNASAQIAAANELAASRGGRVPEIAKLRPGQFYVASDGLAFQRIDTPFCLTHHPPSPLTQEEILGLAANGTLAA